MPVTFQPFAPEWSDAVRAFNRRLKEGGMGEFEFPYRAVPGWQINLATEQDAVRGGYILIPQQFWLAGQVRTIAHYRLPLSEGAVSKNYATLGAGMLRHALKANPWLFALGMGGLEQPLPRMLRGMGWSLAAVPFYFRVLHASRFLRNIRPLRRSAARRLAMDAAALTGVGAIGFALVHRYRRTHAPTETSFEPVQSFGDWTDEVWQRAHDRYALAMVRDAAALNRLYPASDTRFVKIRVSRLGATLGWAVGLSTQMQDHKQFGNMRVGTLVDGMSAPEDASAVVTAAEEALRATGADLLISNQMHVAWVEALRAAGWLNAPSNFAFAASKKLAGDLAPWEINRTQLHLNRGDGDGPIHL